MTDTDRQIPFQRDASSNVFICATRLRQRQRITVVKSIQIAGYS